MKIYIRNAFFFIFAAIIVLFAVTCIDPEDTGDKKDDGDDIKSGDVHFATLDIEGEQVWMPNYNTGKISQMLLKFEDNRKVDVIVEVITGYNSEGIPSFSIESVGSGKIEKGILTFKVDEMDDSNLLDSDDLLLYCFNEWYLDKDSNKNITMDTDVKGNIISLVSLYKNDLNTIAAEGVIREGFSGTSNSLTGEYIYYIYVKDKCKITAGEVKKAELKYTFNKFELSLEAGWNTILKSETYRTTGDSSYSITVSNPSIKWVNQKIK